MAARHEDVYKRQLYGKDSVTERHRHRYEFNPAYRDELENAGLVISAVNDEHGPVSYTHLDVYKRQGQV